MTSDCELDDIFWKLEELVRTDSKVIRKLKPRFKKLCEQATDFDRVEKLSHFPAWQQVGQSNLLSLTTRTSAPFVKVALGLAQRRLPHSPVSLMLWWRRMVAVGQTSVLTYFSWTAAEEFAKYSVITGSDLARIRIGNEQMFRDFQATFQDDRSVELTIREALGGLSMQSDVRKAWKEWALRNHPDKGGDAEEFLRVKLIYDEWVSLHKDT
jgi:hypothetical protein